MDYLTALYDRFCGGIETDTEAEEMRHALGEKLDREQHRLLLAYSDKLYAFCEENSVSSFICGFRLAAGIAAELYSKTATEGIGSE